MTAPKQPTGLHIEAASDSINISWPANDEPDIKGYNIYGSTTSGGGISGYVKLNSDLITIPLRNEDVIKESSSSTVLTPGTRTTTIVESVVNTNIFGFSHENLLDGKRQYYVITAVNNLNEESLYSAEIYGLPLNLTTDLVKFPIRTTSDVADSMISSILDRNPNVDVKPGTMTRDIHVDPQASQFGGMYQQIDFLSRSQSFLTLLEIDDPDHTGTSVAVSDSDYKQALKLAYNLDSDDELQDLIDVAFDRLAGNVNVFRKGSEPSTGEVTFYTTVRPTADIQIPIGTAVSTNAGQSIAAVNFETTEVAAILVASVDSYFNAATQRYEVKATVQASSSGSNTNVNSNSIVNSSLTSLRVTNAKPTRGGIDSESNLDLAVRGMLAITGLDLGRIDGYMKTTIGIHGVEDVLIADAGHELMQRDYDEVRNRHVYGKVDVYFKGELMTTSTETMGMLYKKNSGETATVLNATNQRIRIINPNVNLSKPAFFVQSVYNVTRAGLYDLLGHLDLFKNFASLPKSQYDVDLAAGTITFDVPLQAGDQIIANYKYKTAIVNETLIIGAIGGENVLSTDTFPIAETSEIITLTRGVNTIIPVRDIDYSIDNATGTISILNGPVFVGGGLANGDSLVISYDRIQTVTAEVVVASAAGGETSAGLAHTRVLESVLIEPDGITINIDQTNAQNLALGMGSGDIVNVTYYYRDTDPITLIDQPVDSVVSFIDSSGAALIEDVNYTFNNVDDPLLTGNSVLSERSITLKHVSGSDLLGGSLVHHEDTMNLVEQEKTAFSQKGVDPDTVVVMNLARTVTYTPNVDYLIVTPESPNLETYLMRTASSAIPNGGNVTVEYRHGEQLTITYNVNSLIRTVQDELDVNRHVTADVLAKQANKLVVDLEFSIRLSRNASFPVVRDSIITRIANLLDGKKMGDRVSQSDIIGMIDGTTGVDYVVVPLTKMVVADGIQIANEQVIGAVWTILTAGIATSYKTGAGALRYATAGNVSDSSKFWRVSQDDRELELVGSASLVDDAAGRAFIGPDGSLTVSTFQNDDPSGRKITVSYVVSGESGSHDIVATDLDYLSLGNITIHQI